MADLKNPTKNIYKAILSIASNSIAASFKRVQDGDGSNSGLGISNNAVKSYGNLSADGDLSVTGTATASEFFGSGANLTGLPVNKHTRVDVDSGTCLLDSEDDVVRFTGSATLSLPNPNTVTDLQFTIINDSGGSISVSKNGYSVDGSSTDGDIAANGRLLLYAANDRYYLIAGAIT